MISIISLLNVNDFNVILELASALPDNETSDLLVIASSFTLPVSSSDAKDTVNISIEVSIVMLPVISSDILPATSVAVATQL